MRRAAVQLGLACVLAAVLADTALAAPSAIAGGRSAFVTVVCGSSGAPTACTANVGDAGPGLRRPPTGSVTFKAFNGTFPAAASCTLTPTSGFVGLAGCAVPFQPAANAPQGAPLPVVAHYLGDTLFAPEFGTTGPDRLVYPSIRSRLGSDGRVPLTFINPNPEPARGRISASLGGVARAAAGGKVLSGPLLATTVFTIPAFSVKVIRVKLSVRGRAVLTRKKGLNAIITVATTVGGRTIPGFHALSLPAPKRR